MAGCSWQDDKSMNLRDPTPVLFTGFAQTSTGLSSGEPSLYQGTRMLPSILYINKILTFPIRCLFANVSPKQYFVGNAKNNVHPLKTALHNVYTQSFFWLWKLCYFTLVRGDTWCWAHNTKLLQLLGFRLAILALKGVCEWEHGHRWNSERCILSKNHLQYCSRDQGTAAIALHALEMQRRT